jgi:hypothetical protein
MNSNMAISVPIGLIMLVIAWYLIRHKENWQYRQVIFGILIGLIGLGGAVGPQVSAAIGDGLTSATAAVARMFNAAVKG